MEKTVFSANGKTFFLPMETLGWNKCSEIFDMTEISIKYLLLLLYHLISVESKRTKTLGIHNEIHINLY